MYQPPHFRETETGPQHELIERHPLGLLISSGPGGIIADPVPMLLYRDEGPLGTLRCHLARANPQWQALTASAPALVVFQGADAYVSPGWYATKAATHKVVPTWNYAVVQARGAARIIDDPAWLHAQVSALSDRNEAGQPRPWAVTDAPEPFIAAQLKGIVGIEIVIETLEGKFKASQNRPEADRAGVAAGLEGSGGPAEMIAMVRERGGV